MSKETTDVVRVSNDQSIENLRALVTTIEDRVQHTFSFEHLKWEERDANEWLEAHPTSTGDVWPFQMRVSQLMETIEYYKMAVVNHVQMIEIHQGIKQHDPSTRL